MDSFVNSIYVIFVAGCIGAAAPEIVRLYKIRSRPFKVLRTYWLFSVLFFFLGGVFAIILPATTLWGAVYVGISVPTIVSSWGGKVPSIREKPIPPSGSTLSLIRLRRLSPMEFLGSIWI